MNPAAKPRRVTAVLAVLTVLVLAASLPGAWRDVSERGGLYLFSQAFLEDLPKRLTGPGRFRFLLQPLFASLIGVAAGRADAKAGRTPYLFALLLGTEDRAALLREAFHAIVHLLLAGILLDAICQWLILGVSHPGAALVVGPVLIALPYAVSRALANRITAGLGAR